MEIINGIFSESFWWCGSLVSVLTVAITGLINGSLKIQGFWCQLVSWVIAVGLSFAAYGLKLISFGDPQWLGILMMCIVTGLSSNGVYDIPTIKKFIDSWFPQKQ